MDIDSNLGSLHEGFSTKVPPHRSSFGTDIDHSELASHTETVTLDTWRLMERSNL